MKKFMHKTQKGITLVALVITIIVLIILAAVSINAVMNDGLIKNAKKATDNWDNKTMQENLKMASLDGDVLRETLPEVKAGEYTGQQICRYIDTNGEIAIIPPGFTVSNVPTEITIKTGLVIYAGNQSSVADMTTRQNAFNQYVWIPVKNPSEMYGTLDAQVEGIEGYLFGKLYNFGDSTNGYATNPNQTTHCNWPTEEGYSKTGSREPAYLESSSSADNSSYNIDSNGKKIITKEGLETEFYNMILSVEKFKGFYIGRYELNGDAVTASVISPGITTNRNILQANTAYIVNTNLRWYGLYTLCEKLTGNDKSRTTMIWGCQWDQAVKMALTDKEDFLTNPTAYGVYSGSVQQAATKNAAYNIYDMQGNVWDWTLEASSDNTRLYRGGNTIHGSSHRASTRNMTTHASSNSSRIGARAQLYIVP